MNAIGPTQSIFNFPQDIDDDNDLEDVDYGYADDGTANPPPCPICGWPLYSCPGEEPIVL